jgi:hypothetical protein
VLAENFAPDVPVEQLIAGPAACSRRDPVEHEARGIQIVGIDPHDEWAFHFSAGSGRRRNLIDRDDGRMLLGARRRSTDTAVVAASC